MPAALRGRAIAAAPSPFVPRLEVYRLGFLFKNCDAGRVVLEVVGS